MNLTANRAVRRVLLASAALLLAITTACTSQPASGHCDLATSGTWTGAWDSNGTAYSGTVVAHIVVVDGAVTGQATLTGSPLYTTGAVVGTTTCGKISFVFRGAITWDATVATNGRTISGTYSDPSHSDAGAFAVILDA